MLCQDKVASQLGNIFSGLVDNSFVDLPGLNPRHFGKSKDTFHSTPTTEKKHAT